MLTYIETVCPHCGQHALNRVTIHYRKITETAGSSVTQRIVVKHIDVKETFSKENFIRDVIIAIGPYVTDGMGIDELHDLLKTKFGMCNKHCYEIIEQIKIELNLYSPDLKHLFYVNA